MAKRLYAIVTKLIKTITATNV